MKIIFISNTSSVDSNINNETNNHFYSKSNFSFTHDGSLFTFTEQEVIDTISVNSSIFINANFTVEKGNGSCYVYDLS